jgi:thiamine pyrophosphokinase
VIAADGGYQYLKDCGIEPDLVVGDFDSLGHAPVHPNVIEHPVMKDDTDMMLAVKTGLHMGYRSFVLNGGLGGRLDHSMANLQTLAFLAGQGARAFLIGPGQNVAVVRDGALAFRPGCTGTISVFSSTERSEGVTLSGLKYGLTDYVMTASMPIGVSNEFIGEPAVVRVRKGTLFVFWTGALDQTLDLSGR